MNVIHNMETLIKEFTGCDKLGANLASNAILDAFDKLGLELVEKKDNNNIEKAIDGLENYTKALEDMSVTEFDYCYSKLIGLEIDNYKIDKYIELLKKNPKEIEEIYKNIENDF